MSDQITLRYRCKLCGATFARKMGSMVLPDNTLALMQLVGLMKHNCPDEAIGIAELEGYRIND